MTAVSKNKVCLKGTKILGYLRRPRKCVDGTESYSTTGIPGISPTVAASLGQVRSCPREL